MLRRWFRFCNSELLKFIIDLLGNEDWVKNLELFKGLEKYKDNDEVLKNFMKIKYEKKV